ncbi:hypothetical protein SELMODRAFT_175869 [Selaginella moellendorffii]|uniref:F-box domain-containing protein n=1 Tax=Selaginella moellendorffii TaxID=88036 RepID=D8S0H6_SELML|nr:F-box protein SKIP5 [Selaginella moellendorffii]EFJ22052.1 hypothetical protein SELMODRAFT_175869 [Selaginella moellendorffii]|eukprot:XP_002976942.1 F-box protein SKIP5 [Selaginella moellendorffii]
MLPCSRSARRGRGQESRRPSINLLDDGCLVRVLGFLAPFPDRFNAASVCSRWHKLIADSRMWLRVQSATANSSYNSFIQSGEFATLQDAVNAARPGDTIFIGPGEVHAVANVAIDKPLCLMGGGSSPEETVLISPSGSESALVFSANGKIANLTIKAELGSCLLHRRGSLTVDRCALECEEHPLEYLSCPIVTTAGGLAAHHLPGKSDGLSVIETRIVGGTCAVKTVGSLVLQQVRVLYSRAAVIFWFTVAQQSKSASSIGVAATAFVHAS